MPAPWSQFVKEDVEKAFPMGDFRRGGQERKLESLMGLEPETHRDELLVREQRPSERPLTRMEEWEQERTRAQSLSAEANDVALKRDSGAWADADGYAQVREAPAFRDGYNTTLRVKPSVEEHLHNGLKSLPVRNASTPATLQGRTVPTIKPLIKRKELKLSDRKAIQTQAVAHARANDLIHRAVSKRALFTQAVGAYFMRGLQSGVLVSAHQTVKAGTQREEIGLLLRALETEAIPQGFVSDAATAEVSRRKLVELSRALGNAFVELGMTLPAGKRDDPLRGDSVALKLGNTLMQSDSAGVRVEAPHIEENMRREVATAVGRAILHLRNAANIQANSILRPTSDSAMKDRALQRSVGSLTLQLLESSASRFIAPSDSKRREVLACALGKIVLQLESGSGRDFEMERNREDKSAITRLPAFGAGAEGAAHAQPTTRHTNTGDILVRRPLLPLRAPN